MAYNMKEIWASATNYGAYRALHSIRYITVHFPVMMEIQQKITVNIFKAKTGRHQRTISWMIRL